MLRLALTSMVVAAIASAQSSEVTPPELEGVGITEKLGERLPLDTPFRDASGKSVRLGEFFGRGRPVVITMNYARCPMLCKLQLEGFVDALRELDWTAGKEFDIVTVSIDPKETPERARFVKGKYLRALERPEAAGGWHFLTGSEADIQSAARALGFGYRFVPENGEFAHTAALMFASPSGVICRYLYGVQYSATAVRLALVESGEGKTGSAVDKFLLYCFSYDSKTGRYAPAAFRIMRAGGVLTVVLLGLLVFGVRRNRRVPCSA